ncbi:MAG: alkaline phosphatase family protein [Dehalococcoidia bacterium]
MKRVVIIGLDGACWGIVMPWIEQGELPNLGKLLAEGVYSELRSVIPPMTPPAWTSLVTGKNPGKHGITFEFFKQKTGSFEREIVSALDNKEKCIWDYLSEHDMSSIVINVPVTHPARKMKGILIPGYMAPANPVCFPRDILDEFQQENRAYKVYTDSEVADVTPEKRLQDYIDLTRLRKEATLYYARKYEWDFLMVEFQTTDAIFHTLGDSKQENLRLRLYKCVDECIGEILEALGKNAGVLLVSDHGMGKCKWQCCINSWLKEEGLLTYRSRETTREDTLLTVRKRTMSEGYDHMPIDDEPAKGTSSRLDALVRYLGKAGITLERADEILSRLHLTFLEKKVPQIIGHKMPRKQIDWAKTKVYCPSPLIGVRINLKGREPEGTVEPGQEYHDLRRQIIEKLQRLRTPDGELVFEQVLPREEYYHGGESGHAPDILFVPNDSERCIEFRSFGRVFRPSSEYWHKMDGLFAASGPDIARAGHLPSKLSILDVAPTVLHAIGLPVPRDIDGRVLTEIFNESSEPAMRPIVYQERGETERVKDRIRRLKRSGEV